MVNKHPNRIKSLGIDRFFDVLVYVLATVAFLIILLPLINVVVCSFSGGRAVQTGKVLLWPKDVTVDAYKMVFEYKDIWIGYRNTIYYTVVGTFLNIVFTTLMAYPLSRRQLRGRAFIMRILVFTMMFSGGLIPNYLLVKNLGLINTSWSLWLPGAAQIDGCSNWAFLLRVVLPVSKAILAVMVLLYAVGHWNTYFNAMLYLSDKKKYPLQIFLRDILISTDIDMSSMTGSDVQEMLKRKEMQIIMKYALIVVSSVPILIAYPFVQKYLVKGVMIGSVKG